jgi:hypothetical protein
MKDPTSTSRSTGMYCMQAVRKEQAGTMLAIDMSLSSAQSIVSPVVAGWLLLQHSFSAVATCSTAVMLLLVVLMHVGVVRGASEHGCGSGKNGRLGS